MRGQTFQMDERFKRYSKFSAQKKVIFLTKRVTKIAWKIVMKRDKIEKKRFCATGDFKCL